MRYLYSLLLFILLLPVAAALENTRFTTRGGDEINISRHLAEGNALFIWLPSSAGSQASEQRTAEQLSERGIEVWHVDLLEDFFLPQVASSMERIPPQAVAELIQYAISSSKKQVFLVGTGRGAIPLLRGARDWQQQHPGQTGLGGTILMSPNFFVETPDPGIAPQLLPIVRATNLPLFILQPDKSPWFWKLEQTVPALQQQGSDVYVRILRGVRGRFNFRPDATEYEKQLGSRLAVLLAQARKLLSPYAEHARQASSQQAPAPTVRIGKKDRVLQAYQGNPRPPELRLESLRGQHMDLAGMKGQVVLVNFWASWCPPCVHEMPSMQRLQDKFKNRSFTILGVNMAEDQATIETFLNTMVKVSFPILLDSDGAALKRWGVFAFPTSYVVDKQGQIRYALFGGVEWDTPDIMEKINKLLDE